MLIGILKMRIYDLEFEGRTQYPIYGAFLPSARVSHQLSAGQMIYSW